MLRKKRVQFSEGERYRVTGNVSAVGGTVILDGAIVEISAVATDVVQVFISGVSLMVNVEEFAKMKKLD